MLGVEKGKTSPRFRFLRTEKHDVFEMADRFFDKAVFGEDRRLSHALLEIETFRNCSVAFWRRFWQFDLYLINNDIVLDVDDNFTIRDFNHLIVIKFADVNTVKLCQPLAKLLIFGLAFQESDV